MKNLKPASDFEIFLEIKDELLNPIDATPKGSAPLDPILMRKLYESKLIYLESLRVRCFQEINSKHKKSDFDTNHLELIVEAIRRTRGFIRENMVEGLKLVM